MTKYILTFILLFLLTGCNNNKNEEKNTKNKTNNTTQQNIHKNYVKKEESNRIIIKLNDLNITFTNNKLVYPKNKTILLFEDNTTYSKMQEEVLKQLKLRYTTVINNKFLENYFKIKVYPTIIILDKNKTIKYENFVPLEILKAEGL